MVEIKAQQGYTGFIAQIGAWLKRLPPAVRFLLFAFLFGIMTHGFLYANTLFGHDNTHPFSDAFNSLRWSALLFYMPRAFIQMPWVIGVFTLTELGLVAWLLAQLFGVERIAAQAGLTGLIVTSPAVIAFHNFGNADLFTGALLFSVLGAWLIARRGWLSWLFGVGLLVISIAAYQAFVSTAATVLVLLLLSDLLIRGAKVRAVLLAGIRYLAALVGAVALYYILFRIAGHLTDHVGVTNYRGEDAMGVFTLASLMGWVKDTYMTVFKYLAGTGLYPYPAWVNALQWGCLLIVGAATVVTLARGGFFRHGSAVLLSLLLLALLPLAMNAIQVLNNGFEPHLLMMFAFIAPWLMVFTYGQWAYDALADAAREGRRSPVRILAAVCAVLIGLSIYHGYIVANADYLNRKLNYDASISLATRILDRVETTEGYTPETPVIFIGSIDANASSVGREGFDLCGKIIANFSQNGQAMTYNNYLGSTVQWFFQRVLSSSIQVLDSANIPDYAALPAVKALPPFPARDCITWADGVLVLKLSD